MAQLKEKSPDSLGADSDESGSLGAQANGMTTSAKSQLRAQRQEGEYLQQIQEMRLVSGSGMGSSVAWGAMSNQGDFDFLGSFDPGADRADGQRDPDEPLMEGVGRLKLEHLTDLEKEMRFQASPYMLGRVFGRGVVNDKAARGEFDPCFPYLNPCSQALPTLLGRLRQADSVKVGKVRIPSFASSKATSQSPLFRKGDRVFVQKRRFAGGMGTIEEVEPDGVTVNMDEGGVERFSSSDVADGVLVPQARRASMCASTIEEASCAEESLRSVCPPAAEDSAENGPPGHPDSESHPSDTKPASQAEPELESCKHHFDVPAAPEAIVVDVDCTADHASKEEAEELPDLEETLEVLVSGSPDEEAVVEHVVDRLAEAAFAEQVLDGVGQASDASLADQALRMGGRRVWSGNGWIWQWSELDPEWYRMNDRAVWEELKKCRGPPPPHISPPDKEVRDEAPEEKLSLEELAARLGDEPLPDRMPRQIRRAAAREQARQRARLIGGCSEELAAAILASADATPAEEGLGAAFTKEWRDKLAVELHRSSDESDAFRRAQEEALKLRVEGNVYDVSMPGRRRMRFRLDLDAHLQGRAPHSRCESAADNSASSQLQRRGARARASSCAAQDAEKKRGFWKRLCLCSTRC